MKDKKIKEVVILVSLLVILVTAAIIQISGGKFSTTPASAPKESPKTEAVKQETASSATAPAANVETAKDDNDLRWVDEQHLQTIVFEVAQGRDPFLNPFVKYESSSAALIPAAQPEKTTSTGGRNLKGNPNTTSAFLPIASEHLGKYEPINSAQTPPFIPPPPPPPNFVLTGIVATSQDRYAAIMVDGRYYTLLEGESIPALGWTLSKIEPYSVVMQKGTQSLSIRLSGGSSK